MSPEQKTIETVVHKLIVPAPKDGYLNDLILCWKEYGTPAPDQIRHTKFSTNINEVNCKECWYAWRRGIYR